MSSPRLKKVRQKVARTFARTPSGRAIPCWGRSTPSSDQVQWWMISPTAEFRRRWDLMIMTFIVYNAFLIPLVIAFELEGPALRITSLVVDAFFWVDIVCNFATAYEVRGVLETSPRKIARRYLTGWFACDLVSTIPYEEIMISSGAAAGAAGATSSAAGAAHAVGIEMASDAAGYVKLLKLIRLVRLFRVMRLTRIFSRMDITLGLRTAQVTLVKHLIFIITIAHWYACLLYLVAQLENFSPRSWVNQVRPPIRTGPRYLGEQYIAALYWSITTMATIGYGDIVPKTTFERVVITFVELTAVSFYAYAVTNVVTVIAGSNREAGRFKELIDETNEWMGYRQLPTDIRLRVREYLMHRRQTIMLWHERELLADFSESMRAEVLMAIHDRVLDESDFLRNAKLANPRYLCDILLALRPECFPAKEDVFNIGDRVQKMFIINRGQVGVYEKHITEAVGILTDGDHFGETAFTTMQEYSYKITTITWCDMLSLARDDFAKVNLKWPDMAVSLEELECEDAAPDEPLTPKTPTTPRTPGGGRSRRFSFTRSGSAGEGSGGSSLPSPMDSSVNSLTSPRSVSVRSYGSETTTSPTPTTTIARSGNGTPSSVSSSVHPGVERISPPPQRLVRANRSDGATPRSERISPPPQWHTNAAMDDVAPGSERTSPPPQSRTRGRARSSSFTADRKDRPSSRRRSSPREEGVVETWVPRFAKASGTPPRRQRRRSAPVSPLAPQTPPMIIANAVGSKAKAPPASRASPTSSNVQLNREGSPPLHSQPDRHVAGAHFDASLPSPTSSSTVSSTSPTGTGGKGSKRFGLSIDTGRELSIDTNTSPPLLNDAFSSSSATSTSASAASFVATPTSTGGRPLTPGSAGVLDEVRRSIRSSSRPLVVAAQDDKHNPPREASNNALPTRTARQPRDTIERAKDNNISAVLANIKRQNLKPRHRPTKSAPAGDLAKAAAVIAAEEAAAEELPAGRKRSSLQTSQAKRGTGGALPPPVVSLPLGLGGSREQAEQEGGGRVLEVGAGPRGLQMPVESQAQNVEAAGAAAVGRPAESSGRSVGSLRASSSTTTLSPKLSPKKQAKAMVMRWEQEAALLEAQNLEAANDQLAARLTHLVAENAMMKKQNGSLSDQSAYMGRKVSFMK